MIPAAAAVIAAPQIVHACAPVGRSEGDFAPLVSYFPPI